MYNLILYDTSNFVDFPIGGQLTSIRNFLKYIVHEQKDFVHKLLLVGITNNKEDVGKVCHVEMDGLQFDFLPVLYRDSSLSSVKKSLRLEYVKALIQKHKLIHSSKNTIHYIHTPEAFIEIKLFHPFSKTVIFSHGSFFNMVKGFRFFQNNKVISWSFDKFIAFLLRRADLIFTLDEPSTVQYKKYTNRVIRVENSIVLPQEKINRVSCNTPIRLLFVGRLSKVKRVDTIIDAVKLMQGKAELTIVGDGEEYDTLVQVIKDKSLENNVKMVGSKKPHEVAEHMKSNDILVMNSILEGKPMTILEAMSYGLPIITTPVGGISDMTEQGKNVEYTNGECNEIKDAIFKIADDYLNYVNNSIIQSLKYDYKYVNKTVFEEIYKLLQY